MSSKKSDLAIPDQIEVVYFRHSKNAYTHCCRKNYVCFKCVVD